MSRNLIVLPSFGGNKKMKKLAIIGASYLQEPLIEKAKSMGIETHVFAWAAGDVGEKSADYFYPISIVEKDEILKRCREIGIDGICTIASDLAVITVNYVANNMGLTANSIACTEKSTNKHLMRAAFEKNGDPSPKSILVSSIDDLEGIELNYPIIVKPIDRSGSRGITKLQDSSGLVEAIEDAKAQGFEKEALVEEFATGQEYSIECVSWKGKHHFLAMTHKFTTGAPHFIETGHMEPAPISQEQLEQVKKVVFHALDSLEITYGASHTELKIAKDGTIALIEIGGRMGGDFIGSNLVQLSTGIDFVKAVIDISLGEEPDLELGDHAAAGVRFVFDQKDVDILEKLKKEHPEYISLSDAFFGGHTGFIDAKVKVLYGTDEDDIISQYVTFTKVYNEQMKQYGRTRETIMETIRICKDKNVLREYLQSREKEVVSIMLAMYDEKEILREYIEYEKYHAAQEATKKATKEAKENAIKMIKAGKLSIEDIPQFFTSLTPEDIKEIEKELMQTV